MINPTPAQAKDLIDLAERMGIPTDDAIRRVVRHLTELQERSAVAVAVAAVAVIAADE
jgi:hypothetical protein